MGETCTMGRVKLERTGKRKRTIDVLLLDNKGVGLGRAPFSKRVCFLHYMVKDKVSAVCLVLFLVLQGLAPVENVETDCLILDQGAC